MGYANGFSPGGAGGDSGNLHPLAGTNKRVLKVGALITVSSLALVMVADNLWGSSRFLWPAGLPLLSAGFEFL